MACPICTAPAKTINVPALDGRRIKCPNCGLYDVSAVVLERGLLERMDQASRREILDHARRVATRHEWPIITSYLLRDRSYLDAVERDARGDEETQNPTMT